MKAFVRLAVLFVLAKALSVGLAAAPVVAKRPIEAAKPPPSPLDSIRLPPGFTISLFAAGVDGARSLALGEKGTLFVGSLGAGNVYAIRDPDGDGVADEGLVLLEGLPGPNGIAVHEGDLYVAAAERVFRLDDVEANLESPKPVVIYGALPSDRWHGWRYASFGPDGWLYVSIGAPCNVCEKPPPYATIMRMKPDGSAIEPFALGVRNSVGFDWDPKTGELWFTDNGRDHLGDDRPPDELNHAPKGGLHFGFPYCHGGDLADPEMGAERACSEFVPPAQKLGPHVAAIGMRFYDGDAFPEEYRGAIFVAEHGSWNRSTPIGYRVTVVRPWETGEKRYQPFAEGWLRENGRVWGRPADLIVAPDGSLLVSDDGAGAIYRIRYEEKRGGAGAPPSRFDSRSRRSSRARPPVQRLPFAFPGLSQPAALPWPAGFVASPPPE